MMSNEAADILVYSPSMRRLLFRLATTLGLVGAFVVFIWAIHPDITGLRQRLLIPIIIFVVSLAAIHSLVFLYRTVSRTPALVIREDGIVDNGSLIYGGVGFFPWASIRAIAVKNVVTEQFFGFWRRKFLIIIPADLQHYERSLPLSLQLQRKAIRWGFEWSPPVGIFIPQFVLPADVKFIRLDISTAYYRWHPQADTSIWFD